MNSLLSRLLKLQNEKPVLFYALLLAFLGWGFSIAATSEIEAFPELTNVQVQVITQYSGKAAEEVERKITVPVEVAINGLPGLINQRSLSIFGLSVVTLTFDDKVESKQARIDVNQRLNDLELPEGVRAALSSDSTPLGEIYRYTMKGEKPVDEMRLIQDWRLEREFKSIPGVADVVSFGGPIRTLEVKLDVPRLKSFGLTIASVSQAIRENHANAGGSIIRHGDESYIVRSIGLYEKPEDLEQAVVATQKGVPIRVRDLGTVQFGSQPRLGQVSLNDNDDIVEGIILLRKGSDTLETCRQIRERIEKLNNEILPPGVKIVPYYDRTQLIEQSAHTVFHNILEGILLVCVVLALGLGFHHIAMTIGVALIIPFALMVAFVAMKLLGYAPNLISLGAVDFGIIVETAIFAAEAVIVAVEIKKRNDTDTIRESILEVLKPAFLCAFLLLIAFIPILSLQRVEGRMFKPLGVTLIAALLGGQIGALIFIPIFSKYIPLKEHKPGRTEAFFETVIGWCRSISLSMSRVPRLLPLTGFIFVVAIGLLNWGLGREFLPQFNEGALWIRASAPQTISREAATELGADIRDRLRDIPEVTDMVSQIGRPDDGTDTNGFDNVETYVSLKDPSQWTSAKSMDGFVALAQKRLGDIEGVTFNFSQPIKDNVDEAISGVKGELVVKVFGTNLEELQKYADKIVDILKSVPGSDDVGTERLLGQPELRFSMNRELLARYGLQVVDAEEVLETALMGKLSAKMLDDYNREIGIYVKPALGDAIDERTLASLPILTPEGARVPLGEVSTPSLVGGVNRIYREQSERRIAIKCSVRGRAVVDFVKEASARIKSEMPLPPQYRTEWSGSFANAERAGQRLMIVVPLCLLAIIIVLYSWFNSWSLVGMLMWEIPFSLVGALAGLRMAGLNLSISAAAGAIVLMGISFLTGMMLIDEWNRVGRIDQAVRHRGRSILISSAVAIIGLVPAAFSHGIGSETARPFAVMILGGLITSLFFTLTVLPAFIDARDRRTKT